MGEAMPRYASYPGDDPFAGNMKMGFPPAPTLESYLHPNFFPMRERFLDMGMVGSQQMQLAQPFLPPMPQVPPQLLQPPMQRAPPQPPKQSSHPATPVAVPQFPETLPLETINSLLLCKICLQNFNSKKLLPRMLACQHTFCQKCVCDYLLTGSDVTLSCPICRRKTILGDTGVSGLPLNSSTLDLVKKMEEIEVKQGQVTATAATKITAPPKESSLDSSVNKQVGSKYTASPVSYHDGWNICSKGSGCQYQNGDFPRGKSTEILAQKESRMHPMPGEWIDCKQDVGVKPSDVDWNTSLYLNAVNSMENVSSILKGTAESQRVSDTLESIPDHTTDQFRDKRLPVGENASQYGTHVGLVSVVPSYRPGSQVLARAFDPSNSISATCVGKFGSYDDRNQQTRSLKRPSNIACSDDGTILVVDEENCTVQFFAPEGHYISSFKVNGVKDACFLRGKQYVAVASETGLTLYTKEGHVIKELPIGCTTTVIGYGEGFVASHKQQLSVCRSLASCVIQSLNQVTSSWPIRQTIRFRNIVDIAVNSKEENLIFALDADQVLILTPYGILHAVFQLGIHSIHGGQCLGSPSSIAVYKNDIVLISGQCNMDVFIFDTHGKFLGFLFGGSWKKSPNIHTADGQMVVSGLTINWNAERMLAVFRGHREAEVRIYDLPDERIN